MKLTRAIVVGYKEKYFCFSGRASRSEYIYFNIANTLIYLIFAVLAPIFLPLDLEYFDIMIVMGVGMLLLLSPMLAVAVRRLHDLNYSGWWYLAFSILTFPLAFFDAPEYLDTISLIVSTIITLALVFLKGSTEENKFGTVPE